MRKQAILPAAYLIVGGQNASSLYQQHCETCPGLRQLVWTSAMAVIELVLCLFPNLDHFRLVSLMGAAMSVGYCLIATILKCVAVAFHCCRFYCAFSLQIDR
jgi:hypothetical protein